MNEKFIQIKSNLLSEDITDIAFRIFCILLQHSKNNLCFPSQVKIAEQLKRSRTTINKAIKELEEKGLIIKEKRVLGTGKITTNCYYIDEKYTVKTKLQQAMEQAPKHEEKEHNDILDYNWLEDKEENYELL